MRTLRVRHADTLHGGALTKRCMRTRRRLVGHACYSPHRGKPRQLSFGQSRDALDRSCAGELAAEAASQKGLLNFENVRQHDHKNDTTSDGISRIPPAILQA
ncbi:hypothetical protein [Paenibacillus ehimensis]|uniref:Uncharacterized protein n=1 Tax=Paenibacillus ehimensis TaxID=79264 RepID=A0ABT8VKN5_9BACL|nr:hypothetical protein [Paenibacillus ehimensis]MDO3681515.1 hypothetical protein [Paenibacillus ehimensis]MEC0213584.1 hypothetical protein [Paenibacillus ehimensis]